VADTAEIGGAANAATTANPNAANNIIRMKERSSFMLQSSAVCGLGCSGKTRANQKVAMQCVKDQECVSKQEMRVDFLPDKA
jgi:hypothetical protein